MHFLRVRTKTFSVMTNPVVETLLNGSAQSQSALFSNWKICHIVTNQKRNFHNYAVLVLNRPLTLSQQFMKNLWNDASLRITVDGGTTRWDKFLSQLPAEDQQTMKLPDIVCGDFDSISNELLDAYKKKGCKVISTPDQDFTDFTKSLMELTKYCQQNQTQIDHVIAIGQVSGRVDQFLGNIQTLYLARDKQLLHPNTRLFLIADDSISWLLSPGKHFITVPKETLDHERSWCSLVPIGEECSSVTTTGLKWDLNNRPLKFGDVVSTSNAFVGVAEVTVECSHSLLWSMKLPHIVDK